MNLFFLFFFIFTFPKKWVGRAMGNEKFYGDGLYRNRYLDSPHYLGTRLIEKSLGNKGQFFPRSCPEGWDGNSKN